MARQTIVKDSIIFFPPLMDDFNRMWVEEAAAEAEEEENVLDEETPEYTIRNGVAKYELLCSFLLVYFHAKHGESMGELIAPVDVDFSIRGGE